MQATPDTPLQTLPYAAPGTGPRLSLIGMTARYAIAVSLTGLAGALAYQFLLNPASRYDSFFILLTLALIFATVGPATFGFTLLFFRRRHRTPMQLIGSLLLGVPLGAIPLLWLVLEDQSVKPPPTPALEMALPLLVFSYSPLAAVFLALWKASTPPPQ